MTKLPHTQKKQKTFLSKVDILPWVKTFINGIPTTQEQQISNFKNSNNILNFSELDKLYLPDEQRKILFADEAKGIKYITTLKELEEKYLLAEYNILETDNYQLFKMLKKSNGIIARNILTNKLALGLKYPQINLGGFEFEEIFILGNEVSNFFHGIQTLQLSDDSDDNDIDSILQFMEKHNYSDMHLYPMTDLYYGNTAREHSNVKDIAERPIPAAVARSLQRQLIQACNQDPYTRKLENRGLIKHRVKKGNEIIERNFRVHMTDSSTGNTIGKTVSIRKLPSYRELELLGFEGLSYTNDAIELISEAIDKNHAGGIIISGATNSGKTMLLMQMIIYLNRKKGKRVISIERPIEIPIPNIIQIDLTATEDADEAYRQSIESVKKSILSQDPDVVGISEVRSQSEVDNFADLTLEGHLAFTTMHSNDILSTLKRYSKSSQREDMNTTIKMMINQELVNKKCPVCNGSGKVNDEPCPNEKCSRGSIGRLPVYEIATFTGIKNDDDLFNFAALLRDGKMKYISKTKVVEEYKAKDWIFKDDYERIIRENRDYQKEHLEQMQKSFVKTE